MNIFQSTWLRPWSALLLVVAAPAWAGQSPREPSVAPVPSQIAATKRVFVSNAGGDCAPVGNAGFSGGRDRPYNQFYSALKEWGRYELAASPSDADLAFEISFRCPPTGGNVAKGNSVPPLYDAQFRLRILDVKTHIVLWGITEHVVPAILQGNRDKNFDGALNKLVDDVIKLVAGAAPSP